MSPCKLVSATVVALFRVLDIQTLNAHSETTTTTATATTTTTTGSDRLVTLCFSCVAHFMAESSWQPVMSAAQRRRQRRLRSWWRHEQQSIAAALATSQHLSALQGQKKDRAGEGDFELNFAAKIRRHPPPQAAGTVYYPMDVDDVPAAGGSRPDRLLDVSGPQERLLWGTVEQNVEPVRGVPVLACAADGGPSCGSRQVLRLTACYRSAHDHS